MAVTIVAFFLQTLLERSGGPDAIDGAVLIPGSLTAWSVVSYAFLHGGLAHLLGNMLFLYVFGPNVEDRFGRVGFLAFYLLGAVVAGLAHALVSPAPVIGASGAVAAVTGAFLVLFPRTRTKVLLWFLIIGVFSIPSWWLIVASIAKDTVLQGLGANTGVAHGAHLGGYIFGAGVALALLGFRVLPREPYDLFSMFKQRVRRRRFAEAALAVEAAKKKAKDSPHVRALAEARARVTLAVDEGRLDEAREAYVALVRAHGAEELAATLPRNAQLAVANAMLAAEDHARAADAYGRFLASYGSDTEAPSVRLMLGLLLARRLNDPSRAKSLLLEARRGVRTAEESALVEELLTELG